MDPNKKLDLCSPPINNIRGTLPIANVVPGITAIKPKRKPESPKAPVNHLIHSRVMTLTEYGQSIEGNAHKDTP